MNSDFFDRKPNQQLQILADRTLEILDALDADNHSEKEIRSSRGYQI